MKTITTDTNGNTLTIITNNQPRELFTFEGLTKKEAEDFDYVQEDAHFNARFFRYKGNVYDAHEFMACSREASAQFKDWDGYTGETYFSGVLIKLDTQDDTVIVARYYC